MGVSTDAILAFGFNLGEELPEAFQDGDGDSAGFEFDEWLNQKADVDRTTAELPEKRDAARAMSCTPEIDHMNTETNHGTGGQPVSFGPGVPPEVVA